jgi:hypothetical protein
MFNTKRWVDLCEQTYGYESCVKRGKKCDIFYAKVINDVGTYIIVPPFGDCISLGPRHLPDLERFTASLPDLAIQLKICSKVNPKIDNLIVEDGGFVHAIEYDSYEDWNRNKIKCKFRNQVTQGARSGLRVSVSREKKDIVSFWEMHAQLRIEKFGEIPQPRQFFLNIHRAYFEEDKGFLIGAYDLNSKLVAGIVVLLEEKIAYYKFAASHPAFLALRPNNLLMDRLIAHLDEAGVRKLNLGYTGFSDQYRGLRKYKISAGAIEIPRHILKTHPYTSLNKEKVDNINCQVLEFIRRSPSMGEVDEFSQKCYSYFV